MKPPSAAAIDKQAKQLIDLQAAEDAACEKVTELRNKLIPLVEQHGSVHHKKSKLLRGILYEMMLTISSSTTIDAAAVEKFREACTATCSSALFHKLFKKTPRWELQKGAHQVIAVSKPPRRLKLLFKECSKSSVERRTLVAREQKT